MCHSKGQKRLFNCYKKLLPIRKYCTCTPSFILVFCNEKSRHAIFAFRTFLGMAWDATVQLRAYPFTNTLSLALRPWAFRMLTAFIGYEALPLKSVTLIAMAASTTISEKKSASLILVLRKYFYNNILKKYNILHLYCNFF